MAYARDQGYPVPAVDHLSDDGTDLIMERVEGASMVEVLGRRPWRLRSQGALLAGLHRRLHLIPGPDWLPSVAGSAGTALLHLDLHPLNVLLGPSGPVVIDWTNAARGDPAVDVALSWVLMTAGEIPGGRWKAALMSRARGLLVSSFLRDFDRAPLRSVLRSVVEAKCADPHMSEDEQRRMWAVVVKAGEPGPGPGSVEPR
jgi:hypothetical protein